jgi:hypothetical protein
MLVSIIESCFEFLHPNTVRMIVNACALVVAKIVDDETLYIVDAAEVLKVDVAQLKSAEHFVIAVLLRTSHPSGRRIAPTKYVRSPLRSYAAYNPACTLFMREIAATQIADSWRLRLARRAERVAAQPATNKLAAKLAAAITMQRAYRKAQLAKIASPVCIRSCSLYVGYSPRHERVEPVAKKAALSLEFEDSMYTGHLALLQIV